jgi:hypothetical protein
VCKLNATEKHKQQEHEESGEQRKIHKHDEVDVSDDPP